MVITGPRVLSVIGGGYADNLTDAVDRLLIFVLKMEAILSCHIRHIVSLQGYIQHSSNTFVLSPLIVSNKV